MKMLLLLFLALIPSVILADNNNRSGNDEGAPAVNDPCIKENGVSPVMEQRLSMTNLLVTSSINAVIAEKGITEPNPCPSDRKAKDDSREEGHKTYDPLEDNPYLRLFPD